MLGKSVPESIFIKTAIVALQLIAPLSMFSVIWTLLAPTPAHLEPTWAILYSILSTYSLLEAVFFVCVYLPRRYHLQKAANHPRLSRKERQALFRRCCTYLGSTEDYPSGWFFQSRDFQKHNVLEWLSWAFFSAPFDVRSREEWEEEIHEYLVAIERLLGRALADGYNKDTPCMRPTLDPVSMTHRPLLWYLIVGVIDFITYLRLYALGFRHYSDKRLCHSFPPRPLTLLSRSSNIDGLSYWYRPHHSDKENPVLFLHGIGIGLHPYTGFLADLASQYPDIGILVPEFLSISSRIAAAPLSRAATLTAIRLVLDSLGLSHIVVVAHSYGTAITAQLWRSDLAPRITATLFVDPIPFLLHLPDVAYNFVYRQPRYANEWLLWYFASRDPDVARTLARHFFWAENVLWREDLEGRRVAVALSGRDQVVHSEAVRRYLTGEPKRLRYWRDGAGRLEVLCFPELDHAMIFNARKRWGRLMHVLGRFVCERN